MCLQAWMACSLSSGKALNCHSSLRDDCDCLAQGHTSFQRSPTTCHWSVSRHKDPAPLPQLRTPLKGHPTTELPWDQLNAFGDCLTFPFPKPVSFSSIPHRFMPRRSLRNVPHGNLYPKNLLSGEPYLKYHPCSKWGSGSRTASHIGTLTTVLKWGYPGSIYETK